MIKQEIEKANRLRTTSIVLASVCPSAIVWSLLLGLTYLIQVIAGVGTLSSLILVFIPLGVGVLFLVASIIVTILQTILVMKVSNKLRELKNHITS